MRNLSIGNGKIVAPEIGLGCMRITGVEKKEAKNLIETAMDLGINFFDHADIYAAGEAESYFADAIEMNSTIREKMILQSKCGIKPGLGYDFSKEYILQAAEGSLKRLKTDYLDILLLHRPDMLMEPEEVAEAFQILKNSGKVKCFGVSNQNPNQIELLNKYCGGEVVINQLQLSITECGMMDAGINVNMNNDAGINRDGSILDYCRLKDIRIQAWSPFQYGFFKGVFLGSDRYPELNKKTDELAEKYHVTNSAITIAWILRHPAGIQPIVGTTNVQRLKDISKASDIRLTREEWYEIYRASGKKLP
ncbi:MAG: aldo/keto reductase [Oscillospiraceae bacterium]